MMPRRMRSYVNPHRTALLVIDMQNAFLAEGGYYDRKSRGATVEDLREPSKSRKFKIRQGFPRNFVARVQGAVRAARAMSMPTIFVKASYSRAFAIKPP